MIHGAHWDQYLQETRAALRKLAGPGPLNEEFYTSYGSALRAAAGGEPSAIQQVRGYEHWQKESGHDDHHF